MPNEKFVTFVQQTSNWRRTRVQPCHHTSPHLSLFFFFLQNNYTLFSISSACSTLATLFTNHCASVLLEPTVHVMTVGTPVILLMKANISSSARSSPNPRMKSGCMFDMTRVTTADLLISRGITFWKAEERGQIIGYFSEIHMQVRRQRLESLFTSTFLLPGMA